MPILMESLKFYNFNPLRRPAEMSAEDVLTEYLHLQAGHQDERHERNGQRLAQPDGVKQRIEELETHILNCVRKHRHVDPAMYSSR